MENLGQWLKIDAILAPQSLATTTGATAANLWRSMEGFHKALMIVTGIPANSETFTITLKQATDAAGTDPQNFSVSKTLVVTGATVVSPVGTTGLTRYGYIEFDQQEVYARGSGTHLFVGVSVLTAGTFAVAGVLLRGAPRYSAGLTSFPTSGGQADTAIL